MGNCIESTSQHWFEAAATNNIAYIKEHFDSFSGTEELFVKNEIQKKDFTALMYGAYYGHIDVVNELKDEEYDIYNESSFFISILSNSKIVHNFKSVVGYSALEYSIFSGSFEISAILLPFYTSCDEIGRFFCFEPPYDIISLLILNNSEEGEEFLQEHFLELLKILKKLISPLHLSLCQLIGNKRFANFVIQLACSRNYEKYVRAPLKKFSVSYNSCIVKDIPEELIAPSSLQEEVNCMFLKYESGERLTSIPKFMGELSILLQFSVSDFVNHEHSDNMEKNHSVRLRCNSLEDRKLVSSQRLYTFELIDEAECEEKGHMLDIPVSQSVIVERRLSQENSDE